MKFAIQPDHIPVNKYALLVAGLPPITLTSIGSFNEELDTVDLPDRTKATGGRTKPGDTELKLPMHHVVEAAAMDLWYSEGQDPVSPIYKKVATLNCLSNTGIIIRTFTIIGLFLNSRQTPDLEMGNDGDMAELTYGACWDDVL